jgi:hypothetical protein
MRSSGTRCGEKRVLFFKLIRVIDEVLLPLQVAKLPLRNINVFLLVNRKNGVLSPVFGVGVRDVLGKF